MFIRNMFCLFEQCLQFVDKIFEMEWLTLDNNLKKSLIIMMARTIMPIEITSAYTISMDLDSFVGVSIKH